MTERADALAVAFSPDGKRFVTTGRKGLRIWDAETGTDLQALGAGWLRTIAFSPDGRRIVTSGESGRVQIWETDLEQARAVWHAQAELRPIRAALDHLFEEHVFVEDVIRSLEEGLEGLSPAQCAQARELARLREDPNPSRLNEVAWAIVDPDGSRQGDPARALKLARAAVALDPENPALRDTLAWALLANGLLDEGLVESERALELVRGASGDVKPYEGYRDRLLTLIEQERKNAKDATPNKDEEQ